MTGNGGGSGNVDKSVGEVTQLVGRKVLQHLDFGHGALSVLGVGALSSSIASSVTIIAIAPRVAASYAVATLVLTYLFLYYAYSGKDLRMLAIARLFSWLFYLSLYRLAGLSNDIWFVATALALVALEMALSFLTSEKGLSTGILFGVTYALTGPIAVLASTSIPWGLPVLSILLTALLYVEYWMDRGGSRRNEKYFMAARAEGVEVYDVDFLYYTAAVSAAVIAMTARGALSPLASTLVASAMLYAMILATALINVRRSARLYASIIPQTVFTAIVVTMLIF